MSPEFHPAQALQSISFVFVPLSGHPKLAFHFQEGRSGALTVSDGLASDGDSVGSVDSATGAAADEKSRRVHSFPRSFFADFLCAKAQLCDAVMDITIDNHRFIGYPSLLPSTAPEERRSDSGVKSFNVVFTLDRTELLRNRGEFHIPTACARAAQVLTKALKHEELRCGYLTEQIQQLRSWTPTQQDENTKGGLNVGSLSTVLIQTFQSLRAGTITRVPVNGWLEVSLPPPYEPKEASLRDPIRPYQTFLPKDSDTSKLEALLPRGTSDVVRMLLREANPCKSFEELEIELDVPIETVIRAAGHLVEWNLGMVTETITKNNVYVVSSDAEIAIDSRLYQDFEHFSGNVRDRRWSLPGLLLQFSTPQTLAKQVEALEGSERLVLEFIACLIWLIRSGLVTQLKTFIYLNLFDQSDEEKAEMLRSKYGKRDDYRVFLRLCNLFDGTHHVEDIMWRENISRAELFKIVEAYDEVLTTCVHE